MNLTKVAIALTICISNVAAAGARPAATQAYLMLTKSDHIRHQLISKLGHTNRAVLKQRIKNAKMRAQLFNLLNQQQKPTTGGQKNKSNGRMNRFRQFHN